MADLKASLADVPLRVWGLYPDCAEGPTYYLGSTKNEVVLHPTTPSSARVAFDDDPQHTYDDIPVVSILSDTTWVSCTFKNRGKVYGGGFLKARLASTAPVWALRWESNTHSMTADDLKAQLEYFKANRRLSELEYAKAKLYFPYDFDAFVAGLR
jgi:hypothetical protein